MKNILKRARDIVDQGWCKGSFGAFGDKQFEFRLSPDKGQIVIIRNHYHQKDLGWYGPIDIETFKEKYEGCCFCASGALMMAVSEHRAKTGQSYKEMADDYHKSRVDLGNAIMRLIGRMPESISSINDDQFMTKQMILAHFDNAIEPG